jgi:hypothetical protein
MGQWMSSLTFHVPPIIAVASCHELFFTSSPLRSTLGFGSSLHLSSCGSSSLQSQYLRILVGIANRRIEVTSFVRSHKAGTWTLCLQLGTCFVALSFCSPLAKAVLCVVAEICTLPSKSNFANPVFPQLSPEVIVRVISMLPTLIVLSTWLLLPIVFFEYFLSICLDT